MLSVAFGVVVSMARAYFTRCVVAQHVTAGQSRAISRPGARLCADPVRRTAEQSVKAVLPKPLGRKRVRGSALKTRGTRDKGAGSEFDPTMESTEIWIYRDALRTDSVEIDEQD